MIYSGVRRKVLFFYTKTGNGHFAVANAIGRELQKKYTDSVQYVDPFDESNKILQYLGRQFYNDVISHGNLKFLFEMLYAVSMTRLGLKAFSFFATAANRKAVSAAIEKNRPDVIVVAHFFFAKAIAEYLKLHDEHIPVYVVVTDPFTSPEIWYVQPDFKYMVFSERIREQALSRGVDEGNIRIVPVILKEEFKQTKTHEEIEALKKKYSIGEAEKTILILYGGTGLPNGLRIVKNTIRHNQTAHILVVCGEAENDYEKILAFKQKRKLENVDVFKFVDFVDELISIADIVISKAGTSSVFEILTRNKIPVICNYIWGQEKGTVEYLLDNRMGCYQKNFLKIGKEVSALLKNQPLLDGMKKNIAAKNISNGLSAVAETIHNADF